MPLVPTNYSATCDVPDCTQQALGTLQHLSTKGWQIKAIYNGKAELCSILTAHGPLICPECSVLGRYK